MKFLICIALLSIKNCFCISGKIWSKQKNDFVDIFSIKEFKHQRDINEKKYEDLENHKFNGDNVTFISREAVNRIEFYDEDRKVTGIDGEIWTALSEYLNFTLSVTKDNSPTGQKLPNGSFSGLLGKIKNHEYTILPNLKMISNRLDAVDFVSPFWSTGFKFFIKSQNKFNTTWLFDLFSLKTWCLLAIMCILMSISSIIIQKIASGKKFKVYSENLSTIDYFFYNFGAMCNQGALYERQKTSKILSFSASMFSWFLLTILSSRLITYLTQTVFVSPFENYQTLYENTDFIIYTLKDNSIHNIFKSSNSSIYKDIQNAGRIRYFENEQEVLHSLCSDRVTIIRDKHNKFSKPTSCDTRTVGEMLYDARESSGIDKKFPFKRSFDKGVIKLREVGIIQALKTHWLRPDKLISEQEIKYAPITLEQVSLIIYIYVFGLMLSIMIFIAEKLVYNMINKPRVIIEL